MHFKLTYYLRIIILLLYMQICNLELFTTLTIFHFISLKIGYFELGDNYDVTVTSYLEYWYLFWCKWKEENPAIL